MIGQIFAVPIPNLQSIQVNTSARIALPSPARRNGASSSMHFTSKKIFHPLCVKVGPLSFSLLTTIGDLLGIVCARLACQKKKQRLLYDIHHRVWGKKSCCEFSSCCKNASSFCVPQCELSRPPRARGTRSLEDEGVSEVRPQRVKAPEKHSFSMGYYWGDLVWSLPTLRRHFQVYTYVMRLWRG